MRKVILLALALPLLGGCSQDTEFVPGGTHAGEAIPLMVDNTMLESGIIQTRAFSTLATNGAGIGIFCSKGTGYDAEQNNISYTYSTATNTWGPTVATAPVWLLSGDADVCAYYPYNAASNFGNKTTLPLASAVYSAAGDICFAGNRTMNGTPFWKSTTFNMKRALAKMALTLKKGDFPGTCSVTSITLTNTNLPATATFNITNEANVPAVVTKASLAYAPLTTGNMIPAPAGTAAQEVLLIPFTLSGDFSITLAVDGKNMQIVLPATTFSNSKIEAGKNYKLTLKINGTELDVTSVAIEDWTDVPMTDGGNDYVPNPAS